MHIMAYYSQRVSTCVRDVVDHGKCAVFLMYQVIYAAYVRGSSSAASSLCVVLCIYITVLSPTQHELEGICFPLSALK